MTDILMTSVWASVAYVIGAMVYSAWGAALFRFRGDDTFARLVGRGKTTADGVWALGLALPLAFVVAWYWVLALALALWAGGRAPWWKSIDMGRSQTFVDATPYWQDVLLQGLRGFLWTFPAAFVVLAMGRGYGVALIVAGLSCALWYEIGWRINPKQKWRPYATEIGELLFGGAIACGLYVSLV